MMQWAAALVLAASTVVLGDDCTLPKRGERIKPAWDCCDAGDINFLLPEDLLKNIRTCSEENPLPEKPPNPEDVMKNGPSTEIRNVFACQADCVFTKAGLTTSDNDLDKEAISKMFENISNSHKVWVPVIPKILDNCFNTYRDEIDTSLECKSGALEFQRCVVRQSFLQCPTSLWTDKRGCGELKDKIEMCPNFPVMIFKPRRYNS